MGGQRSLLLGLLLPVLTRAYRQDELPGWQGEDSRPHEGRNEIIEDCDPQEHTEYWGNVVKWGANNLAETAEDCCKQCQVQHKENVAQHMGVVHPSPCNIWVWCAKSNGCGDGRAHGECWLKNTPNPTEATVQASGELTPWTSGVLLTAGQADDKAQKERVATQIRDNRINAKFNPRVFFDIEIGGKAIGRIEFVLYMEESPRAAENFRALCTGEKGVVPAGHEGAGKKYHFKSNAFYRIIDQFIDQTGAGTDSVFGGSFKDDKGGLKLKHDRAGLLSMANSGPDTNTSHFSILVNAAPHLDGKYTIFGEIISGLEVAMEINKLANKRRDTSPLGKAVIADSGQYPMTASM